MKKIIITIILFTSLSIGYHNGDIYLHTGSDAIAQPCPPNPNGGGGGGNVWTSMGNFFSNLGYSIGSFFSQFSSSNPDPEGMGDEMPEYGWQPETWFEQPGYSGQSGPYDPWNDPYYVNLFHYYEIYGNSPNPPGIDCFGVPNGTAYIDSCGKCVGGTTGKSPCAKDCAGVWGGKSYLDSCNICVDSIRKQPCDSIYKKLGDSLGAYLDKPQFKDSLDKFKQGFSTDTLEKAISLGVDSTTGQYKATGIRFSAATAAVNLINTWWGIQVQTMTHFHPASAYYCFSAGDFYSLKNTFNHPLLKQIRSHFAFGADTSTFIMAIEDSTLYANYLSAYPIDSIMDAVHSFDSSRAIGQDFNRVKDFFWTSTGNDDDAFTQATAFIMSKYNTGLVMYRRKPTETKFTKINTRETIDAAGNKTYAIANCP